MRRRGAATQRSFAHAHYPRAPHSLVAAARHSVPPITHKPNSSRRRDQRLRERARAGAQAHSGPDAGEREQCLDIMKRAGAVAEGEGRGGGGGGLAKAVFRKVWRNEVRPFDKHRNIAHAIAEMCDPPIVSSLPEGSGRLKLFSCFASKFAFRKASQELSNYLASRVTDSQQELRVFRRPTSRSGVAQSMRYWKCRGDFTRGPRGTVPKNGCYHFLSDALQEGRALEEGG